MRREIGVLFVFSLVLLGLGWGGPHVRRGVPVSNFYTQGIFVLGCWTIDWRECVGFWCTTNNEFYGKFLFFLSFKSGFIIAFCIWEYFFSQLDVFGLWVSDSLASPVVFKGCPGMTFWRTSFRFYVCEYICKNLHSLLLFAMLPLYKITTM